MSDLYEDNMDLKEEEIVCRVIASSAVHGAIIFKDFHAELFRMTFKDIDLETGFLSIKKNRLADSADESKL